MDVQDAKILVSLILKNDHSQQFNKYPSRLSFCKIKKKNFIIFKANYIIIIFLKYFYLCIMNLAVLGLSCSMWDLQLSHANSSFWHMGSSSLTRDQAQVPGIGHLESQPLSHQGSQQTSLFNKANLLVSISSLYPFNSCSVILEEISSFLFYWSHMSILNLF